LKEKKLMITLIKRSSFLEPLPNKILISNLEDDEEGDKNKEDKTGNEKFNNVKILTHSFSTLKTILIRFTILHFCFLKRFFSSLILP
jgi:hypothetical protein